MRSRRRSTPRSPTTGRCTFRRRIQDHQPLTVDYASQASNGFGIISDGAIIDGRGVSGGADSADPVQRRHAIEPDRLLLFEEEGTLFIDADTNGYAFVLGKPDFSDAHNSMKIDHLVVNNADSGRRRRVPIQLRARQRPLRRLRLSGRRRWNGVRADPIFARCRCGDRFGHRRSRAGARKRLQFFEHLLRRSISKCRRPACRLPSITTV